MLSTSRSTLCLSTKSVLSVCSSSSRLAACRWNRLVSYRFSSALNSRGGQQVLPNLRNQRPLVNGKAVAFHIRDLIEQPTKKTKAANALTRQPSQREREYESDLVVVLDMDECLIHSQFLSPGSAKVFAHQLQRSYGTSGSQDHCAKIDSFCISLPDGEQVHVNVRPGLYDFLDAVTSKYETHIFTAAMEVYAKGVLDRFDPAGERFAGRWYRESCAFNADLGAHIKDLEQHHLPFSDKLNRVVLVDNNPLSFIANPSNGILVKSFYNDPTDSSLAAVWQLLEELDAKEDVRPALEKRFGFSVNLKGSNDYQQQQAMAA